MSVINLIKVYCLAYFDKSNLIKRKWGICNMRYSIIVVTAVSGCLFCSIMIFSTLSPLPRGDSFNSAGMWINVVLLLFVYILFLVFFIVGFICVNFVLCVVCVLFCCFFLDEIFYGRFLCPVFIILPVYSGDYSNSNRLDVFCFRFSYVTFALYSGNFNKYKLVCCCFSKKPTVFSIDYRRDYLL